MSVVKKVYKEKGKGEDAAIAYDELVKFPELKAVIIDLLTADFDSFLESVDWVNVVALDDQGRSLMIRQFRFGVGYTTLETPGGMIDPGEDSKTAAARELLEETGYASSKWTYLGAVEPNPAYHNNLCHHWLAEDVYAANEQDLGDGESIALEFMTQLEVRERVQSGELKHALALSALSRVFPIWPVPFAQADPQITET